MMTNAPPDPHTVDDVFRCTQESIAPIMEVIRTWLDEQKRHPVAAILSPYETGATPVGTPLSSLRRWDAEHMFEDLEETLGRKIGAFLATDRLTPIATAAIVLRQRMIRTLQEHRE